MTTGEPDRKPSAAQLIELENMKRARSEGAFVSPCGTEGARWEGFPEWPEPFPYDALGTEDAPDKLSR